jgi:hypothetical protein
MKKGFIIALAAIGLAMGSVGTSYSQITGGAIAGTIQNANGETLPGAKVTVVNKATNRTKMVETSGEGGYRLSGLSAGEYKILVESNGYAKVTRQVTLQLNEDARADFELTPVGSSETMDVLASRSAITEASNSVLGAVIENKQITQLPLNGRNFLQLGSLVANVTATASLRSAAEGGIHNGPFAVAGQRDRSLTYLVDGVDDSNTLSDALTSGVSIDAIEEFKMITSLGSAEFGFHSGAQVNIITRAGSNLFHATAFEFFRDNRLNAANYFESIVNQPPAPFLNNQFGGSVGGPLIRDKVFFFASYEGQRLHVGSPQFADVPTQNQRNGIFINPATGQPIQLPVDPVSARILALVPVPNASTRFGNFISSPQIQSRNDYGMARVDYLLSGNDVVNVRYLVSDNRTLNPIIFNVFLPTAAPPTVPGFGTDSSVRTQNLAIAHTHNFGLRTINDLRFGYNLSNLVADTQSQVKPSALGFQGMDGVSGLFGIDVGSTTLAGNLYIYPQDERISNFHLSDSLSVIRGRHSLKIGGEARWLRDGYNVAQYGGGFILFTGLASRISPLADMVMGIPSFALKFNRSFGAPIRASNYGFYVQDDFQVNKRLVLNLGLRYELNTVLSSPTHKLTNYSPALGLYTPGLDSSAGLYQPDHRDFAPRIGFAWSPTRDGRTVVRGGYGLYYDAIDYFTAPSMNLSYPAAPISSISFAPPAPGTLAGVFSPQALVPFPAIGTPAFDQHIRTPYAQHFNLNIQRELGRDIVLSVGYVGSAGSRLLAVRDINQAIYIPGIDAQGNPLSTQANVIFRRPTQLSGSPKGLIGAIDMVQTVASSHYNSFEATFSKRFGRGLSILSSYTWSKSIDDATDPLGFTGDSGGPQDSTNPGAERGLSIFDMRHRFTAGVTYTLPFHSNRWIEGWQVNTIISLQSGQPFTPVLGFDPSFTGSENVRPNDVPGAIVVTNGQLSFNPSLPVDPVTRIPLALIPAPGHFGTMGRDTFTGPGYHNVDISGQKEFRLNEKFRMQARLEVFNIFNTANLGLPDRRMTDPLFGISTKTQDVAGGSPGIGGGGPRVMQLAVKFVF